jgi:Recombination endonuclease VII
MNFPHPSTWVKCSMITTDSQVLDIRRRCALGTFQKVLAAEFNVSQGEISRVVRKVGRYGWPSIEIPGLNHNGRRIDASGRECALCGTYKLWKEFSRRGYKPDGSIKHHSWCKSCRGTERQVIRNSADTRREHLRNKFGITPEQYEAKLAEQGGGCAICGSPPKKIALHVDHDHSCCPGKYTCGKCLRGILCWPCNVFIGKLEGVFGAKATAYLREVRWEVMPDASLRQC